MIDAWLHGLLLQTITLSIAAVAVRALQATVMRRLGAAAAYLCWLLVPVAMLAAAMPHPSVDALALRVDVSAIAPAWIAAAPVERATAGGLAGIVVASWSAGVLLLSALLVRRQRRFEALVGAATNDAEPRLPAGTGPAVLGVWRRRIVLPQDFDSAFDAEERRLMLLHEGVHLRRADNLWNLLATALLVLHWFNPFAWWAWRCLRVDQETSCDAAVLRREPPAVLAAYAGALLKVQGVALTPPLATSWQSSHPLVERVRMLKLHRISSARHRMGLRIAALSVLVAGVSGYALQAGASAAPAHAGEVSVLTAIELRMDANAPIASRLLTHAGEPALIGYDLSGAPFQIAYTVTRLDGDRLQIDAALRQGAPLAAIGSPRLVTHDGEAANISVRTADGAHEVAISFVPKVLATPPALPAVRAVPPTSALPPLPPVPPTAALAPPPAPPNAHPALPPLPAEPPAPVQRAL